MRLPSVKRIPRVLFSRDGVLLLHTAKQTHVHSRAYICVSIVTPIRGSFSERRTSHGIAISYP